MAGLSDDVGEGGCQCGAVRYRVEGPALDLFACHCRECQRQSGSAHGLSLIARRGDLRVIQGAPARWTRPTDSGGELECFFCPTCGARLWHQSESWPDQVSVKAGTLDAPPDLSAARHIWTTRAMKGVVIPEGADQWPEEPLD